MRIPPPRIVLLASVGVLLSCAALEAAITDQADGVIQIYCSDEDGSRHPKKIKLVQPLFPGDVEALQQGRLLVGYDRDGGADGKGKIKAIAKLRRKTGVVESLGKISVTQNRVTGETVGLRDPAIEFALGDEIAWTFKLKKFDTLDAGECISLIAGVTQASEGCGPYESPNSSPYTMPFHPGQASVMSQANCSGIGSHRFQARHAYDFALPLGTDVLAIQGGVVQSIEIDNPDGMDQGDDNVIAIQHDDGNWARYVHLQQNSALVSVGQRVSQGEVIALSGNSGSTGGIPHLHLQLSSCPDRRQCGTLPMTFNNTSSHPNGLQIGKRYKAN